MALLSWGKCKVEYTTSTDGEPGSTWTEIDTPKENTTKITPTAGEETIAKEEGGDIVDSRNAKTTYVLEFDLFVKKGKDRPFSDDDGIISGEFAFRITPEDKTCKGSQIDRCTLRVEESYTTADGTLLHYVARCMRPASGKTVKEYIAAVSANKVTSNS